MLVIQMSKIILLIVCFIKNRKRKNNTLHFLSIAFYTNDSISYNHNSSRRTYQQVIFSNHFTAEITKENDWVPNRNSSY